MISVLASPDVGATETLIKTDTSKQIRPSNRKMTPQEARELKVGDRVYWLEDQRDQGTVVARNWSGVEIKWENNASPLFYFYNDMNGIKKFQPVIW